MNGITVAGLACLAALAGSPLRAADWNGGPFQTLRALAGPQADDAAPAVRAVLVDMTVPRRASRSYSDIVRNNDGSTSIIGPYFSNPTGEGALQISGASSLNGVCKLYGFGPRQAAIQRGDHPRTAVIGESGKITGYRGSQYINQGLDYIVCGPSLAEADAVQKPVPTVEERAEKVIENDDGSVTLYRPHTFKANREKVWFSARSSSHDGICRYFGFSRHATLLANGDYKEALINVNSQGRIAGTTVYGPPDNNDRVDSIVCQR